MVSTVRDVLDALLVCEAADAAEVLLDQLTELDPHRGLFTRLQMRAETRSLSDEEANVLADLRHKHGGRWLGPLSGAVAHDAAQRVRGSLVAAQVRTTSPGHARTLANDARWRTVRWLSVTHLALLGSPQLVSFQGLGTAILDDPRTGPFRTEWGVGLDLDGARRVARSMSHYPWPGLQVADGTGRLYDLFTQLTRLKPQLKHLVVESPVLQQPVWLSGPTLERLTARIPVGAAGPWVRAAEDDGIGRVDLLHGGSCATGLHTDDGWVVTLRANRADLRAPMGVRIVQTLVAAFGPIALRVVLPGDLDETAEVDLADAFPGAQLLVDRPEGLAPLLG